MKVVLASWNVHGWRGSDRTRDPARTFEVIRELDADAVALQEVEGSDGEALAKAADYRVVLGHTGASPFGNALLVRQALASVRRLDLSVPGCEPRGALDATISLDDGPLRVVATHLGLRVWERRRQAERLARLIEERDGGAPLVLLGDLNDWTPWAGQLRPLVRSVGRLSRIPTFPSHRPVLALDRAAWRAPGCAPRLRALRARGVRIASDHLPLRLELRCP